MARRQHLAVTLLLAFVVFFSISYLFAGPSTQEIPQSRDAPPAMRPKQPAAPANEPSLPVTDAPVGSSAEFKVDLDSIPKGLLEGESIAPKLENATLKAELGRATWKFLHTMAARFPEKPTEDDRTALETFIRLFGRLYPCGECAKHFREMLAEYPPQTSSRNAAAGWLCFAHNLVNERLDKPIFDCNNIGDFYDCGCGDDKKKEGEPGKGKDGEAKGGETTEGT